MMKSYLVWLAALVPLALSACSVSETKPAEAEQVEVAVPQRNDDETAIHAALARLDPGDQFVVNQQRVCAVRPENRLGSMGTPVKMVIDDQPVFFCCGHCQARAQAAPGVVLANVRALRGPSPGLPTP